MPDVSTLSQLTVNDVIEDRKCNPATGKHPTNGWPCRAECDLSQYFDVDSDKQEAYLSVVNCVHEIDIQYYLFPSTGGIINLVSCQGEKKRVDDRGG